MKYFQYMHIHQKFIPQEVLDKYDIIFDDRDFTYVEIRRGMYGLKEAGVVAFDQLVQKLKRFGYKPMPQTPGLWKHTSRRTTFTRCVDDFGIQYLSKADADNLIKAIQDTYECSIDWKGTQYCGLTLTWNYPEEYVDISMPGYVKKALKKFNHKPPKSPEHAPHDWTTPIYGQRTQQRATQASTAPLLLPDRKQRIQAIVGTFLYYGLSIDSTILVTLNTIGGQQSTATTDTETKCAQLMDYLH